MFYKTALWAIFLSSSIQLSQAQNRAHQDVRFYKVNKFLQADRIRFTKKKAKSIGCHNFLKKSRVHRAVQFGYGACSLFSKKDCPLDSVIAVARKKDEVTTTVMAEGYGWFTQSEHPQGSKLRSWYCSSSLEDHPVEIVETEIEKEEVIEEDKAIETDEIAEKDKAVEEGQTIQEDQTIKKDHSLELD